MTYLTYLIFIEAVSTGFVSIGPNKYTYPLNLTVHADNLYNFEAREDDIWIVTFPRSGTTWTQELVWLIANNLNYDGTKREMLKIRSPYLEYVLCSANVLQLCTDTVTIAST